MLDFSIEANDLVDESLLRQALEVAALPHGRLLILAGTADLDDQMAGQCVPHFLLRLTQSRPFFKRRNLGWDVGVSLSPKMCRLGVRFPSFLIYVFAHELSHGHVVLADPDLHVYCAFLDRAIIEASGGVIRQWHELPHEHAHDAFGVWVAQTLFRPEVLESELSTLLHDRSRQDHGRLRFLQTIQPRSSLADLREEVRNFSRPYAKALCEIWDREYEDAAKYGVPSITEYAAHIKEFLT